MLNLLLFLNECNNLGPSILLEGLLIYRVRDKTRHHRTEGYNILQKSYEHNYKQVRSNFHNKTEAENQWKQLGIGNSSAQVYCH